MTRTWHAAAATNAGRVRASNQDCALVSEDLVAVADGMGGHAGGEVAARVAVDALSETFTARRGGAGLADSARAANKAVVEKADQDPELRGMGTTLTAAALVDERDGQRVAIVNVGDSRAYMLGRDGVVQLTEDHSLVEQMVRQGELTPEEALVHPHRHILTRALGIDPGVEVDTWMIEARPGMRILLCSDGLTNECDPEEIATVLRELDDPEAAAHELVRRAVAHGGTDNVTAVVADVTDADAPGAAREEPPQQLDVPPLAVPPVGAVPASPANDATLAAAALTTAALAAPGLGDGAATTDVPAVKRRRAARPERRAAGPERRAKTPPPRAPRIARHEERPVARRLQAPLRRPTERVVTGRVVLFIVALLATLGGVAGFTEWFNESTYYVSTDGGYVAIYQGRPGGMLWFKPVLVEKTDHPVSDVLSANLPMLKVGVLEPSYTAADAVVTKLADEQSLLGITASTVPPSTFATVTTLAPQSTVAPTSVTPTAAKAAKG